MQTRSPSSINMACLEKALNSKSLAVYCEDIKLIISNRHAMFFTISSIGLEPYSLVSLRRLHADEESKLHKHGMS
jgi:hypothetical protein